MSGLRDSEEGLPLQTTLSQANGDFMLHGENHGSPVYRHVSGKYFIYYWDERDGDMWCGWWLGPAVGSIHICGFCPGAAPTPPSQGWRVPWNGPVDPAVRLRVSATPSVLRKPAEYEPEAIVDVPLTIRETAVLPLPELAEEDELQRCCICLQTLWSAQPSVFRVNARRLCPHYFCQLCAQRLISEEMKLVKELQANMRLALVERLPMVLDEAGEELGDLVWRSNGSRLKEGEFGVVLGMLGRMGDLTEGMELRFADGQASVLVNGTKRGKLLRNATRSLQQLTMEDFEADGLGGMIDADNITMLRETYMVLYECAERWACERCTLENSTSKLHCELCGAPPPRKAETPDRSRALTSKDIAALRSRFAIRPRINWAVPVRCPLCKASGCASVETVPDLRKAPHRWFRLAALDGGLFLSTSELASALAAVLPVNLEVLRTQLEGRGNPQWAPVVSDGLTVEDFLKEGGIAEWAAQQLERIPSLPVQPVQEHRSALNSLL